MQMMINMQTQFNERMLKLQEEAAAREERNMSVIHAIQQQQERTNQEWRETESLWHRCSSTCGSVLALSHLQYNLHWLSHRPQHTYYFCLNSCRCSQILLIHFELSRLLS